jgi:hypothetical protein
MEFNNCLHLTEVKINNRAARRVFLSKPSRGKEAWSFAYAKVPMPNASDKGQD